MVDSSHREFSVEEIKKISSTYHDWKYKENYADVTSFCKSVKLIAERSMKLSESSNTTAFCKFNKTHC